VTQTPLYTFLVLNNRVLQFKHSTSIQIARLHSFSNTKSKNIFTNNIIFYENLLACSNHDGTIVVINIYTRKKIIIESLQQNINRLHFLDKNRLLSVDTTGLMQIHDLKVNTSVEITTPTIVAIINKTKDINLDRLASSVLTPLIEQNSLGLAFGLIDDNPMLRETTEHKKLEEMYSIVFNRAIEELCKQKSDNAHKLLENFKEISSKKEQINTLFIDFKHFERFKEHISDEKYPIAYALSSKHTLLTLTPEFQKMEDTFAGIFKLAREQMIIGQKDLATETLSPYMTILSKRQELKNLLSGNYIYLNNKQKNEMEINREKLLFAYEKNDFKECYELIDRYSIEELELVELLEKHWIKLMVECEEYSIKGDIKAIKTILGELIKTKTRVDKIGDLLRVAFYSKIKTLGENKKFSSAQNIIYSYIDIFGVDLEMKDIMKEYEKISKNRLAITHNQNEKVLRSDWLNAALIVEL